jgi:proton-dependent oligopeptide transporter, POT family
MTTLRHPRGLWVLAFGKMWDTFSYFGTQTILALYFIHIFHLSKSSSYLLYGAYAAIAFSAPILGGVVADKWLGSKNSLILGIVLNIAGNLMLVSFNRYLFSLGLATSLIGSGFYKSNATHLVGALYKDGDVRKELGFTWFYLAINVGGTLGPLVYGLVVYSLGWNFGFLCSAVGILFGGLLLLKNWDLLDIQDKPIEISKSATMLLYLIVLLACFLLSFPFYIPAIINPLICAMFAVSIAYLIIAIRKYTGKERGRLFALLLICFFAMFYFAAGLQIGTTITLFIQYKIHQGVINTKLPASVFSALYSLFVLLLAPFFMLLWRRLKERGITLSAPIKLAMGIGFATLGIGAFAFASITNLVIIGVVVGNLLLSAGELVITPAAYTAMSDLAPTGMKSTMMGCWLLFIALGGYLSSLLANAAHFVAGVLPPQRSEYSVEFLFIAAFTLIVTIVVIATIPRLLKMMA